MGIKQHFPVPATGRIILVSTICKFCIVFFFLHGWNAVITCILSEGSLIKGPLRASRGIRKRETPSFTTEKASDPHGISNNPL